MGQITIESLDEQLQQKINSDGIVLPISANDVVPTPEKTFVSSQQKSAIDSHDMEIQSQTARIANIEQQLTTIDSANDKVSMDALGTAGYLSELIDGLTITNVNGKLQVQGINNLLSTITELNSLQGITSNVQSQINNLSGVSVFRGVFTSLQLLEDAPDPLPGQYAIVSENGTSSYYYFYDNSWQFSHDTSTASDIDINTGTVGVLAKNRYVHQNASETSFTDVTGKIQASTTQDAIVEVFRFADSLLKELTQTVGSPLSSTDSIEVSLQKFKQWWAGLANAITNKGVATSSSNNGNEVIQKIGAIPNITVDGGLKRVGKLNVKAPYYLEIELSHALNLEDISTTLFEYIPGDTGVVKYDVKFNNSDITDFESNDLIKFDGVASLKKEIDIPIDKIDNEEGEEIFYKAIFNKSDFSSFESFKI